MCRVIDTPIGCPSCRHCVYAFTHTNRCITVHTAARLGIDESFMYSYTNPQAGLMYESKYCPKKGCGSPMAKYSHQGENKMRCTKTKCRHITRSLVSVYYHQGGATPSSDRIQTELALCFAWGTALHCHRVSDRRPSCYTYIAVYTAHRSMNCCIYRTDRIGMQQVPTLVRDEDGDPIHHGIVERAFDKMRQIIQRYVLDKQEAHVVCILPAVCTFATRTSYIHDG